MPRSLAYGPRDSLALRTELCICDLWMKTVGPSSLEGLGGHLFSHSIIIILLLIFFYLNPFIIIIRAIAADLQVDIVEEYNSNKVGTRPREIGKTII